MCPGVVHCLSNEALPLPELEQKVMLAPSVLRLKAGLWVDLFVDADLTDCDAGPKFTERLC